MYTIDFKQDSQIMYRCIEELNFLRIDVSSRCTIRTTHSNNPIVHPNAKQTKKDGGCVAVRIKFVRHVWPFQKKNISLQSYHQDHEQDDTLYPTPPSAAMA